MRDRVAFIAGASRGIGAAVARAFHEAGARVDNAGVGAYGPFLETRMLTVSFGPMGEESAG